MKQNEINSWLIVLILFTFITGAWYIYTNKPVLLSKFQSPGPKYINIQSSIPEKPLIIPTLFMLSIFGILYFLVYRDVVNRTVLFVLGSIIVVLCGYHLKFYDWSGAWQALKSKIDVLYFLVGMNIITLVLDEGGLFSYLSRKITVVTRGNKWKIMVAFCLATYVFSLLVNNLTTIMVLIPMIFSLSRLLKFDPKPFIIAMIIASNLGGASTMIGDFPNILIGTEMGVPFLQFILYMMPPCLIQLSILLIFVRLSQRSLFSVRKKQDDKEIIGLLRELPRRKEDFFQKVEESLKTGLDNPGIVKRGMCVLGVVLVLFFVSDFIHIPPAIVALSGGLCALFFSGASKTSILERLDWKDIFFFSGLFILVGAAEASGILNWLGEIITYISGADILMRCLILMWLAGVVTAFLNAGPSTALFLPLVASFIRQGGPAPHHLYFWSLSLGVLAGSSATLTGATAGSVSSNLLDEFIESRDKAQGAGKNLSLSFREFARIGIPVGLIFLVVSSIYIAAIYKW